jgi:hypothetical protein
MAHATLVEVKNKRGSNRLNVKPPVEDLLTVFRKTKWIISPRSPKTADDLTFTSRDDLGRIRWWDVTPPKTDYWRVHVVLGRAYAFELLDLLNNPESGDEKNTMSYISQAVCRWGPTVAGTAATGMADGFFAVLSEFLATGTADR